MEEGFSKPASSPFVAYIDCSRRPIACLYFILPFLIIYHGGVWILKSLERPVANGADIMLGKIINIFYYGSAWLYSQVFPGSEITESSILWVIKILGSFFSLLFIIFILLLQQHLSNTSWKINKSTILYMYIESLIFAIPPFILVWIVNKIIMLNTGYSAVNDWINGIVLSVGAGVYEEFLFRMIIMSILFLTLPNLLRVKDRSLYIIVMLVQAIIFAVFHYLPWSKEAFYLPVFTFRIVAGLYFGYIYQERGFGIAAGSHVFYDIIAETINDI